MHMYMCMHMFMLMTFHNGFMFFSSRSCFNDIYSVQSYISFSYILYML